MVVIYKSPNEPIFRAVMCTVRRKMVNQTSRKGEFMTQNQINFMNAVETNRHQLATENQAKLDLVEQSKHNRATELNANQTLSELNRHNLATEGATIKANKEQRRHNKATEKETSKHNRKTEKQGDVDLVERGRHNLATENLTSQDIEAKKYVADRSANASIQSASISAEAAKYSADAHAAATKYAANIGAAMDKYRADIDAATQKYKNVNDNRTKTQIANDDRESRNVQAMLNRAQQTIKDRNAEAIEKQRIELENKKLDIERKYKRGQLTNEYANTMLRGLNEAIRNSLDAANTLRRMK